MTRVYLVRHCEAYGNIYRRLDGVRDTDVTKLGEAQIERLAQRFKGIHVDYVYSSKLKRAVKTAQGIALSVNTPHKTVYELHERQMGIFEGKNWHEVKKVYPEEFKRWMEDFDGYIIPKGESTYVARDRFEKKFFEICKENDEKVIVIVTHSMVIKAFLDKYAKGEVPYGNNTAVSFMEISKDNVSIKYVNDDSHLTIDMKKDRDRWVKKGMSYENYSLRYECIPDCHECYTGESPLRINVYEENEIIGFLEMQVLDKTAIITDLKVFDQFQRRGYGTQFIGEAIYRGLQAKCNILQLCCDTKDENIDYFIQKNNFLTRNNQLYIIIQV